MKANFQNGDIIVRKGEWSMDAIFNRTSIRKYKQESLKKEEIDLILKAAFSAPSARNSQPWQFIVVENKDTLKDLSQMTPYASFLKDAAMGMVVCADKNKNVWIIANKILRQLQRICWWKRKAWELVHAGWVCIRMKSVIWL